MGASSSPPPSREADTPSWVRGGADVDTLASVRDGGASSAVRTASLRFFDSPSVPSVRGVLTAAIAAVPGGPPSSSSELLIKSMGVSSVMNRQCSGPNATIAKEPQRVVGAGGTRGGDRVRWRFSVSVL